MNSTSLFLLLPAELVLDDALELSLELALELCREDCHDWSGPFLLLTEPLLLQGDIPTKTDISSHNYNYDTLNLRK